jgi:DNA polymerase Ligase (LigD)
MPRFVVLEHDHPELHWDFMLEVGGVLRTWQLAAPPRPGALIPATASFDHRLVYLDYEGPVSGKRGRVVAWDRGTFAGEVDSGADVVEVRLQGQRLHGTARLEREASGAWTLRLTEV